MFNLSTMLLQKNTIISHTNQSISPVSDCILLNLESPVTTFDGKGSQQTEYCKRKPLLCGKNLAKYGKHTTKKTTHFKTPQNYIGQNPGKHGNMEKIWQTFGKDSMEKYCKQTTETWPTFGKVPQKTSQRHGKLWQTSGTLWQDVETLSKNVANIWQTSAKRWKHTTTNICKILQKTWKSGQKNRHQKKTEIFQKKGLAPVTRWVLPWSSVRKVIQELLRWEGWKVGFC